MTKSEALHAFFSGFGIAAYPDSAVDNDATLPRLTYTAAFDSIGSQVSIPVNLWYRTESELVPTAKAQEISDYIGNGGLLLKCDGGYIWVTRGSPFCQSMVNEDDLTIKRRYINVIAEFLTDN